jgi:hypothetical protein
VLPRISKAVAQPPRVRLTKNYDIIKLKVEKFLAYEISEEEYFDALDNIYNAISDAAENVKNIEIPSELEPYFKEQIEIGLTGIELFLEGIDILRTLPDLVDYLNQAQDEQERENLSQEINEVRDKGLTLVAEGTDHLNMALDMAVENMARWKEEDSSFGFYA